MEDVNAWPRGMPKPTPYRMKHLFDTDDMPIILTQGHSQYVNIRDVVAEIEKRDIDPDDCWIALPLDQYEDCVDVNFYLGIKDPDYAENMARYLDSERASRERQIRSRILTLQKELRELNA